MRVGGAGYVRLKFVDENSRCCGFVTIRPTLESMKMKQMMKFALAALAAFACCFVAESLGLDDGYKCQVCGKMTFAGANHICTPRKRSMPLHSFHSSDWSGTKKQASNSEEKVEEEKPVPIPGELMPSTGTYGDDVISEKARVWQNEAGRKIEARLEHISKDCEHVFLRSEKTKKRLDVCLKKLSESDRKYVRNYVEDEMSKGKVWFRGVFVEEETRAIDRFKQREKVKEMIRFRDSIASNVTELRVFQVLDGEALCDPKCATWGKVRGPIKFIPSKETLLVDGDVIEKRFFWCGTYNYETRCLDDRTVHCLTDDPKFAISRLMSQLDRQEIAKKETPPKSTTPNSQSNTHVLQGCGSGFFITEDGYLITNHHVIEGGRTFEILTSSKKYDAKVVKADEQLDIALLKVEGVEVKPFSFASRRTEKLGASILTMGFPQPDIQGWTDPKVTKGIISGDSGFRGDVKLYQIDASIQPGNSGGPVFNGHGCVVGVAVARLKFGQNVNYCIKKSYVLAFLKAFPECFQGVVGCEDCTAREKEIEDVVSEVRDSCVLVLNFR